MIGAKLPTVPAPDVEPATPPSPAGMPPLAWLAASAVVLVLLVAVAIVSYGRGADQATSPAPSPATAPAMSPGTLRAQPIDTGFAADMIDHHEQAVQMSLLAIGQATSPAVRQLALEIATAQRRESGMLMQFLRDRGIDHVDPQRTVMAWMDEPTPHDQMPGLATQEELVALTNADGPTTDALFVQLMLRHHEGGLHMAEFAAAHAESQSIRDLAAKMVVDQQHEITDLTALQPPTDPPS